jgi:hypothetical protein
MGEGQSREEEVCVKTDPRSYMLRLTVLMATSQHVE